MMSGERAARRAAETIRKARTFPRIFLSSAPSRDISRAVTEPSPISATAEKNAKKARMMAYLPKPSWPRYPVMRRMESRERTTVEKTLRKEFKTTI
jgi:hypothetical protein